MIDVKRAGASGLALLLAAGLLAGCSTTGDDGMAANQPGDVAPVTDSQVASDSLPPIGGSDGSVQVASVDPNQTGAPNKPGMPVIAGGVVGATTANTGDPGLAQQPGGGTNQANQGSFVSLNDFSKGPDATGRDLSGGLTIEKLLGGWTVVSGATQCRLNLTYTAKDTTGRYRASTPNCQITGLAVVSSWQLSGTQVQLFNDQNAIIGTLLLTGNRFIGTLSGGQTISMVG